MAQQIEDVQQEPASQCNMCGAAVAETQPAQTKTEGERYRCPQCGTDSVPPLRLLDALVSLNEIGTNINRIGRSEQVSIKATLRLIVEGAINVVPESTAVIYTYDHIQDTFDPTSRVAAGERTPPVEYDVPRQNGMGRRAVEIRRRVISYEESEIAIHHTKVIQGARALVCFPLIIAKQGVGALYVYLHEERTFDQLELLMLENFVNQAAIAIYHARLVSSVNFDPSRKEEELALMRRAGLLISSRPRLEETLEAIIQLALEMTNAQYGIFRLVDKSGKALSTAALAGKNMNLAVLMVPLPIDAISITSWVAQHHQPLLISDLQEEPWASIYRPLVSKLEMRSELAVPLIGASGRLEGTLNLESPEAGTFTEHDSHLLQALATQLDFVQNEGHSKLD